MCRDCWVKAGSPDEWTPLTARLVDLVRDLYAIPSCGVGGPLHSVPDDWNLAGKIRPFYEYWDDEEDGADLDVLWYGGVRVDELGPAAPAVEEGRSIRQLCDEIASILNGMIEQRRYAAMAYADGLLARPHETTGVDHT